jgi:transposase-like protein
MKEKKSERGRPTKYSKELGERLAMEITHCSIQEACNKIGIDEKTYYNWLYSHDDFFQLSTKARKTKAVHHFAECQQVLIESKEARRRGDTEFRSDLARLEADFHLRLAGKANQGLFGDSTTLRGDNEAPLHPVVNLTLNK